MSKFIINPKFMSITALEYWISIPDIMSTLVENTNVFLGGKLPQDQALEDASSGNSEHTGRLFCTFVRRGWLYTLCMRSLWYLFERIHNRR